MPLFFNGSSELPEFTSHLASVNRLVLLTKMRKKYKKSRNSARWLRLGKQDFVIIVIGRGRESLAESVFPASR